MKRLALLWVVLLPVMLMGNDAKLAPELRQHANSGMIQVIVQYKTIPGDAQIAEIQGLGGKAGVILSLINAISAELPDSAIAALSEEDPVTYISPDRWIHAHANTAASAVFANDIRDLGYDGSGIAVAVVDSGIQTGATLSNPAGVPRLVYSLDFVGGGPIYAYDHGTTVAGLIVGSRTAAGCSSCAAPLPAVTPNLNLVDLRVLDNSGRGIDSATIAAIQAAVLLKDAYHIRVLNLSLGRRVHESAFLDPLCRAVEQAWKAGIVVVAAAGEMGHDDPGGSGGYGTIEAPGNDPYVITVGAVNTQGTSDRGDDVMSSFSSKGPTAIDDFAKPDLVAPGTGIAGPGGTDFASAMVSGAAALLLQQNPEFTPDQVKARLMKTASKTLPTSMTVIVDGAAYAVQTDVFSVGAGHLDMQAALADASLAPGTAKSPTTNCDPSTGNTYFLADRSTPWGGAVSADGTWSPTSVWGESAFLHGIGPKNAMWGGHVTGGPDNAMWGGHVTGGPDNAMWGGHVTGGPDNAMWGGSVTPASPPLWGSDSGNWGCTTAPALWSNPRQVPVPANR